MGAIFGKYVATTPLKHGEYCDVFVFTTPIAVNIAFYDPYVLIPEKPLTVGVAVRCEPQGRRLRHPCLFLQPKSDGNPSDLKAVTAEKKQGFLF